MESLAVISPMTNFWLSLRHYSRKRWIGIRDCIRLARLTQPEDYAESSAMNSGDRSKSTNWKAERIGVPVGTG